MKDRLEVVRGVYGLCQLIAPRFLAGTVLGARMKPPSMVVIIRALGARHVVQSVGTIVLDSSRVRRVGGAVDVLHALSMIAVGIARPQHRRLALVDATVAGTFAILEFRQ